MASQAFEAFQHAIQDSSDLLNHFIALNKHPPSPEIEVLKRASLVMALAALETYFEDRISEAVNSIIQKGNSEDRLKSFFKSSLDIELKSFHSPHVDRVKALYQKYLSLDITEGWAWNHYSSEQAKSELNKLVKKRGDIAHRTLRPAVGVPVPHAVTKDDLRKHIHFIKELVKATDVHLESKL